MASDQSSREVLKRQLVAALTPTMSDAGIRAAFQNLHDSVLPLSLTAVTLDELWNLATSSNLSLGRFRFCSDNGLGRSQTVACMNAVSAALETIFISA
jgi:hypothetical protein